MTASPPLGINPSLSSFISGSTFTSLQQSGQMKLLLQLQQSCMHGGGGSASRSIEDRNNLDQYQGVQKQLDGDIYTTNAQIKNLNSKIVKNDYDHTQIMKLQQRHQNLMHKKAELQEAVNNHHYMRKEMEEMRLSENTYKHSLGQEYLQLGDQKKRRNEEERRRVLDQERTMHQHTQISIEQDFIRKKEAMQEQRRSVQQELAVREEARRREKEELNREKEEFNQKVMIRNQVETQKDSVYKQYYSQFTDNQDTLHSIYRNKAAVSDRNRQQHLSDVEKKEIEQFQQKVAKQDEERVYRASQERDMLKSYLQSQIEEKDRKKSRDREEELSYQNQVARYQINAAEAEAMERTRRKEEQHRYDQDLQAQTRSRMHSYGNQIPAYRQAHNPITNPIDFKIGITNPYVIKEFEQAKEKHLGESQTLKVRNLAMVGSATLRHS